MSSCRPDINELPVLVMVLVVVGISTVRVTTLIQGPISRPRPGIISATWSVSA
jgi:hypothetical protein